MKRVRTMYEDLQSLSDVTTSVLDTAYSEPSKQNKTRLTTKQDPYLFQISAFMTLKRRCSSCDRILYESTNAEFLCDQPKCWVYVYHLCKACIDNGAEMDKCPKGWGCSKKA